MKRLHSHALPLLMLLLASFGCLTLCGCKEDAIEDHGIYGVTGNFVYQAKGSLQVGFIDGSAYFNEMYKLPEVPNFIVTARGDKADLFIEGFTTVDGRRQMSNITLADLRMAPSDEGTFLEEIRGYTTAAGSLSIDGEGRAIRQIKLSDVKVTTNRIAISEMRLFFGLSGTDCVRLTNITGVVVRN